MKTLLHAAGLAAWLAMSQASAGISLNGTRVIFDGAHPEASVTVRNHGADILVQSWLEALDSDKAELPFAITPPLTRLPAGQEQLLRILYAGAGASHQQETAFWLNVQEIPQAAGKGNVLQLAVRQRVKVFTVRRAWTATRCKRRNACVGGCGASAATAGCKRTTPAATT